jgi:TonB family protein
MFTVETGASNPPDFPPGSSAPTDPPSPNGQTNPLARELPKFRMSSDVIWYPAKAARLHLQGRILLEFKISPTGQAMAARVLESDADRLLQDHALRLLQHTTFDVADPRFNVADDTPLRATFRFCLRPCAPLDPYPGTEIITITGNRI